MWNSFFPYFRPLLTKSLVTICRNYSVRRPRETYYDILKLPRNCTNKQIKDAYIKLSKEHHPDRNKSKESQERFVKISTAYSVLSKPDSRRSYDLGLPGYHHYTQGGYKYHEVPIAKNPWNDPFFYSNRDKSQDRYHERQPYYGVDGVERMPNRVIAMVCLFIAGIGVFLQILAVRFVALEGRDELLRKSNEAAAELQRVRNKAKTNGHEMQVKLLEQRFKDNGLIGDEK